MRRIDRICLSASFPNLHKFDLFKLSILPFIVPKMIRGSFLFGLSIWWVQTQEKGFGSHGHVPKSENHENDDLSGFPKTESESYSPKCSKIILQRLRATLFLKCTTEMAPLARPPPLTPNAGFSEMLLDFS